LNCSRLELEVRFVQISARKLYYEITKAAISNLFLTFNDFAAKK
jgi:hypothetical protein